MKIQPSKHIVKHYRKKMILIHIIVTSKEDTALIVTKKKYDGYMYLHTTMSEISIYKFMTE